MHHDLPTSNSQRDVLYGQALNWVSWDPNGVVTASVSSMLEGLDWSRLCGPTPVLPRLLPLEELGDLPEVVSGQQVGLALWVHRDPNELSPLIHSISLLRARAAEVYRVAYLQPELAGQASIFVEAGAQVVVTRLPSLQRVLPRIIALAPRSASGFHPLVAGLLERLPWSD
ncbi:hypothetical protein [Aureliella helgolandensis]|uniref:Uncharacterized protein n=1 Tax=Aureliella helgolandensis TaxID=2527968 RepID=A0A518GHP6_9BACT|nr:hypothetical protein [Aureliella helgolandensis]QDV28119.1 hypothetical protein Q31a_65140 [Aureliella helgolandensis]